VPVGDVPALARFSAAHDPLTNIAIAAASMRPLEVSAARSARYGWAFTLVLVDLNNFKAGERQVRPRVRQPFVTSIRVRGCARPFRQGDTAARIGGDEFAVIFE